MTTETIIFLSCVFIIALLYSTVGHGGASGYLALMGFFHIAPAVMRPSALMLNMAVSLIAWWQFSRTVDLNKKLFFCLIAGSIPAAFLGSMMILEVSLYKKILGLVLLFPAMRLLGFFPSPPQTLREFNTMHALIIGVVIGFISGIIGIGGGILLSPLLLLLGWTNIRETALISALFIFVNSISGISGLVLKGAAFQAEVYYWLAVAMGGGLTGAWIGSQKINTVTLKQILGLVLIIAGIKLLIF